MGDWFFGLITGIILTAIVGWACLRRRFQITWDGYSKNQVESRDAKNSDRSDISKTMDD